MNIFTIDDLTDNHTEHQDSKYQENQKKCENDEGEHFNFQELNNLENSISSSIKYLEKPAQKQYKMTSKLPTRHNLSINILKQKLAAKSMVENLPNLQEKLYSNLIKLNHIKTCNKKLREYENSLKMQEKLYKGRARVAQEQLEALKQQQIISTLQNEINLEQTLVNSLTFKIAKAKDERKKEEKLHKSLSRHLHCYEDSCSFISGKF